MTTLLEKLSHLVEAGALTVDDVLQYALYPGRLLSDQEKIELQSIARDLREIVPLGRSDATEYINNAPGNEEWEAKFALGLLRTKPLGMATENDMNETHEGPYFSLFHPLEGNPALRYFAGQLQSGSPSLLRPTTMRNPSKPMFVTPGIENDILGKQTSDYLQNINNQIQVIDAWIGHKQQQLARLTAEGGDAKKIEELKRDIKYLQASSAHYMLLKRQAYGNANAYVGPREIPEIKTAPAISSAVSTPAPPEKEERKNDGMPPLEPLPDPPRPASRPPTPPTRVQSSSDEDDDDEPIGLAAIEEQYRSVGPASKSIPKTPITAPKTPATTPAKPKIGTVQYSAAYPIYSPPEKKERETKDHEALTGSRIQDDLESKDKKKDPRPSPRRMRPRGGHGPSSRGGHGRGWQKGTGADDDEAIAGPGMPLALNPSLIGQVTQTIGSSIYRNNPRNLHVPANLNTAGAATEHAGGSVHAIVDAALMASRPTSVLGEVFGDSAFRGLGLASDQGSMAYGALMAPAIDGYRADATLASVPGSLVSVGLRNLEPMTMTNHYLNPDPYFLSSSEGHALEQAQRDELVHKKGSFDVLALNQQALGRETRPPGGYGPTSNLSLTTNDSLRSHADLTNLFYDGPNFAATGGTEQDELLRLYLEHVKAQSNPSSAKKELQQGLAQYSKLVSSLRNEAQDGGRLIRKRVRAPVARGRGGGRGTSAKRRRH